MKQEEAAAIISKLLTRSKEYGQIRMMAIEKEALALAIKTMEKK